MKNKIKTIGIITSGGDAPGMNACIRAITRSALHNNMTALGFKRGYNGLIENDFIELNSKKVSNIIQRGGTILKTARSEQFRTIEGRKQAYENLKKNNVDALIAIGGDGTFTGASIFLKEFNIPIIGIPGTIDNDLFGTDYTIGYDTALNTVVEAVDKLRDTASSHGRLFVVEVMGKDAGFIALRSGIATGAEAILIPETTTYIEHLLQKLAKDRSKNKPSSIILVAEGDDFGGAYKVAEAVKEKHSEYDIRVTVLGHIQRGGSPTASDRVLASQLGAGAVDFLLKGQQDVMVGVINKELVLTPFSQAIKHHQKINKHLLQLADILAI
ncbi:MAG: 6-phosphofructokinase [Flavobacteriales bacterium]|jgi:6-phosphofructokinase 1|nr:6-phosphofructokinase [Flavobacteriales bacterium]